MKYIIKLFQFIKGVFFLRAEKTYFKPPIPNELKKLPHNCALVALYHLFPEISIGDIEDAFFNCCDTWPNGGVSNIEMNYVIAFLKIKGLNYCGDDTTIGNLKIPRQKAIALIHGHYLVVANGEIWDSFDTNQNNYDNSEGVYCYWVKS